MWFGCATAPWMFFGPTMMVIFILACLGMMFLFMRRHAGLGMMSAGSIERLGPWRDLSGGEAPTNFAFENYRRETLQRLEGEQKEFKSFLEQLRSAKDKTEFDHFMMGRQSSGKP